MYFYNTINKEKSEFIPINAGKVGIYVCGPTVYASPHIGNARSVVAYDLLYRLLQEKYEVTYVRNITDVDDKINAAAVENNETIKDLTERVTADFHEVTDALGCKRPTHEPRATENIKEIIDIIAKLIENGNAYVGEGHVLFDVNTDPNYGHLSKRSLDDMIAGSRVEIAPYKKNAHDFVLWKPAAETDDESAKFESPWGLGRPGWHIECTAMSTKFLGNDFDIHGGGADLKFPHHENEIAQCCCANKGSTYARLWMHNGFLMVNGEKMSKSLGNFTTVRDLLGSGVNGDVIRLALLSSHYRKPLDWTDKLVSDSQKTMDAFYRLPDIDKAQSKVSNEVMEFLSDDLNTSKVYAYFNELMTEFNKGDEAAGIKLRNNLKFMGFFNYSLDEYLGKTGDDSEVEELIAARKDAKQNKDFAEADRIRSQLTDMGVIIDDKRDGSTEWRKA